MNQPNQKIRLIITVVAAGLLLTAASCSISFRTSKQLDGGVFRSADAGETWTQVVNAGQTKKNQPIRIDGVGVQFIRFDPLSSSTLYLSTRGSGIYRSDSSGDAWVKTGLTTGTYGAFAIDPSSPSILYAGSGGTIVKSTDGAASWSPIYLESQPNRGITDLAVKPGNTGHVLAATNTGEILLSNDYGNTWQLFSKLGVADSISRVFFAPGSSTMLYALTPASGIFRSTDMGKTWASLTQNLALFPGAAAISSVAILPDNTDTLYIASAYGLLKTADSGATWQAIQTLVALGSQPIQHVAVNPDNPQILYALIGNKLRKSTDGGINWDAKISIPTSRIITTLIMSPDNPSQLFIGTLKPKK